MKCMITSQVHTKRIVSHDMGVEKIDVYDMDMKSEVGTEKDVHIYWN